MLGRQAYRWLLVVSAGFALLWVAYVVMVAKWLPGELREAAARAGLTLEVGSIRSSYPGELRLGGVQLISPSIGAIVTAERVVVEPRWRALVSSARALDDVRASGLALRWAGGSLGPLEVRWHQPSTRGRAPSEGMIEIEGRGASWRTTAQAATMNLRGNIELRHSDIEPRESARVFLGDGVISISEIVRLGAARGTELAAAHDGQLGMHAILRLENATLDAQRGFEAAGTMYVQGEDASVGLELLNAPESVRWMLSALVGQPFEVESSLRACRGEVALDGLRFESGLTRASGALRAAAGGWSGALQLRRGSLSLGITISATGIETLLSPQPFWLDTELARARDVCAYHGL